MNPTELRIQIVGDMVHVYAEVDNAWHHKAFQDLTLAHVLIYLATYPSPADWPVEQPPVYLRGPRTW